MKPLRPGLARWKMARFFQANGVLLAFLLLLGGAIVWQPDVFLQPEVLRNLVNQNAAVGILAIGMTLVIIGGGIDLSVGSMMALTASVGMLALNKLIEGGSPETTAALVAVIVSMAVGTVLGAINGLVITLGRVAPFIATLVGLVAFRAVALALADGGEIRSQSGEVFPALARGGIPISFIQFRSGDPLVITWPMLIFFGVALLAGFLLNWTRYGRHLVAVGANERAAVYSAIAAGKVKFFSYVLIGVLAGLAAVTLAARINSVTTGQMGLYAELDAIAAVVIGGTSMKGGRGRIWTTVIGVLMLGLITNMLAVSHISPYWQGFVKGVIILLAVLIQRGQSD